MTHECMLHLHDNIIIILEEEGLERDLGRNEKLACSFYVYKLTYEIRNKQACNCPMRRETCGEFQANMKSISLFMFTPPLCIFWVEFKAKAKWKKIIHLSCKMLVICVRVRQIINPWYSIDMPWRAMMCLCFADH